MIVSYLGLRNWKNFRKVDVPLRSRVFLAGPNASGKSNLLDVFKFLRDIVRVRQGGGLQRAVKERGDLSKIRSLAAPKRSDVEIEVKLAGGPDERPLWEYSIGIREQSQHGTRLPYLVYERIWERGRQILNRPDREDREDKMRLTRTYLEQISANKEFRGLARFFESISYQHLIPQLVRSPDAFGGAKNLDDPYGRDFLQKVMRTPARLRRSRLRKIEQALKFAVPQFQDLTEMIDEAGTPHLEATYGYWRSKATRQREDQFSDGTLRLIALLWSLLEVEGLLLLEEPELSLNAAIIRALPAMIYRLLHKRKGTARIEPSEDYYYPSVVPLRTPPQERQAVISTHSADLLSDKGIGGEEVLLLKPTPDGTEVKVASDIQEVRDLLEGGLSVADAVMPRIEPPGGRRLWLFDA
jgi:predicted ATPase